MEEMDARLSALSPAKRALLELRLKNKGLSGPGAPISPRPGNRHSSPLSFAQERLWLMEQLEPGSSVYNRPAFIRLRGLLEPAILAQTLNEIIRRHEVVRTTVADENSQPIQAIAPVLVLTLPLTDLRDVPAAKREAEVRRRAIVESQRPFDLVRGPLVRASLLRLDEREHVLLVCVHHILFDGWSMGVLLRELAAIYPAFVAGRPSPLPELPVQYADFAHWQRQRLQGDLLHSLLAYWKEKLAGAPAVLELPTDRPRPAVRSYRGSRHTWTLRPPLAEALRGLSRREGVTLFMTLLAAFQTLLCRYTGQKDVVVGSPIANRNRVEIEGLIGCFVNTLVLRTDLGGNPTFRELLARTRQVALGAYAHQDLPFEKLVAELHPVRDPSREPLVQVMFALHNSLLPTLNVPGLVLSPLEIDSGTAKFELTLSVVERPEGLLASLEYNSDLFDAATVRRMAASWQSLLEAVVAAPEQRLAELPVMPAAERRQLLVEWGAPPAGGCLEHSIPRLFEGAAERTPRAVALKWAAGEWAYEELNRRSNQLAHFLRRSGVGPEVMVGIYLERSPEMVLALLATLKAGAAYVPLDPEYPADRLQFMLREARTPVVLTQQGQSRPLGGFAGRTISLDTDWQAIRGESSSNPPPTATADAVAYVIFTSGSTGLPKGVLISHRSLAAHCQRMRQVYQLVPDDRVLQFAALNFDASMEQIWTPLIAGATLVLRDNELWPAEVFQQKVRELGLTVVNVPPAYFRQWAMARAAGTAVPPADQLRLVIVGGDEFTPNAVDLWQKGATGSVRLLNAYGPTEATITSTTFEVPGYGDVPLPERIPIGRPLPGTEVYVLDPDLQPVPIGVPGALYIGGLGLAREYLHHPDLTAQKFLPHPFSARPGARVYQTGDLVRWLPDGNLEFLGRIDQQVKVRGFRIELGEIETVLGRHPAVKEVVVVAREDAPGDKRLVAYGVARQQPVPDGPELRRYLQEKLPEHMVPAAFVWLETLPLSPSGKVDRRALPAPDAARAFPEQGFVAARNPVEEKLAGIWAEVLRLERVGVHDNFFALGGHSLLATLILSRLRSTFQVELPLRRFFAAPTIAEIAEVIEKSRRGGTPSRTPALAAVPRRVRRMPRPPLSA